MDTVATITVYSHSDIAETAIDAAVEQLYTLEKAFSYTDPDSELNHINATAYDNPVKVSSDMSGLLYMGLNYSAMTNGAFDISLGALIDGSEPPLSDLGYENIVFENHTVKFTNKSIKLHFGAIAKGYALDELLTILKIQGITSAIVDIGGEIGVVGESHREDGMWLIGIADPSNPDELATIAKVKAGVLATSGSYERGEHIFDRATGRPANTSYASVTVISDNGILSDALSTAIFVKGVHVDDVTEGYCVVFINKEGKITANHIDIVDYCYCNIIADDSPAH